MPGLGPAFLYLKFIAFTSPSAYSFIFSVILL